MRDLQDNAWIQTFTGKAFWPLDPDPAAIDILDIAHALACKNRYSGHTRIPLSVAQHSVLVSQHVPREDALWGLLHDAGEAYLADMPAPLKPLLYFHIKEPCGHHRRLYFHEAEDAILRMVADRFNLAWPVPASIKPIDLRARRTERRDLLGTPPRPWRDLGIPPFAETIVPVGWRTAEADFLRRFDELTKK